MNYAPTRSISAIVLLMSALLVAATGCGPGPSGGGSSSGGGQPLSTLGYTLTGKVVLPDGSSGPGILVLASLVDEGGVSGKQARVLAAKPAGQYAFTKAVEAAAAGEEGSYVTVTDAEGVYVLSGLDTGTYYIEASRNGLKAKARGTVSPREATVVDLSLTPTGSISGYCMLGDLDSTGSTGGSAGGDHSGTFVIVKGTDYIGFTADDGSFTISQVPVDTAGYTVSFVHAGYESADYPEQVQVPAASTAYLSSPVTLTALVGGTVYGTVTAQDTEPLGASWCRSRAPTALRRPTPTGPTPSRA